MTITSIAALLQTALIFISLAQGPVPLSMKEQTIKVAEGMVAVAQQSILTGTVSTSGVPVAGAIFSASPTYSTAPLAVTFTQDENKYDIDFGDGVKITNAPHFVAHTYKTPGQFVVAWYDTLLSGDRAPARTTVITITGTSSTDAQQ